MAPTANIKHTPVPSQVNTNCHVKSLFTSISITRQIMSSFQQIKTKHAKSQEKKTQSEEKKQSSEPDSNVTQMLDLPDREFKITMIDISWILMNK